MEDLFAKLNENLGIKKKNIMNIPKKLNPAPLLVSAINIKFDSDIPTNAIFGILYQNFQNFS